VAKRMTRTTITHYRRARAKAFRVWRQETCAQRPRRETSHAVYAPPQLASARRQRDNPLPFRCPRSPAPNPALGVADPHGPCRPDWPRHDPEARLVLEFRSGGAVSYRLRVISSA